MAGTPFNRLEVERNRRDLPKRRFAAEVLGVSAQDYNNWQNRGFPIDKLADVAGKLNWSLDRLWFGKESAKAHHNGPLTERLNAAANTIGAKNLDLLIGIAELMAEKERGKARNREGITKAE